MPQRVVRLSDYQALVGLLVLLKASGEGPRGQLVSVLDQIHRTEEEIREDADLLLP